MSFTKLTESDKKLALRPEIRAEYAEELASINQFLHDRKAFESIDFLNKQLKEITKHELSEQNLQFLKQISKFFSFQNQKGNSNESFSRSCFTSFLQLFKLKNELISFVLIQHFDIRKQSVRQFSLLGELHLSIQFKNQRYTIG